MRVEIEVPDDASSPWWAAVRGNASWGPLAPLCQQILDSRPKVEFRVGDVVARGGLTAPAIVKAIVEHGGVRWLVVARGTNVFTWQAEGTERISSIDDGVSL